MKKQGGKKRKGGRRTKPLTPGRAHSANRLLTRRVDRQESLLESWFSPSAARWPIEHSVALRSPSTSIAFYLSFAFKENLANRSIDDRSSSVPTIDSRARERGGRRSIPIEPRHDLGPLSEVGGGKKKKKRKRTDPTVRRQASDWTIENRTDPWPDQFNIEPARL